MSSALSWVVRPLTFIMTVLLSLALGNFMIAPAHAGDPIGTAPTFTDGCEGNNFVTTPDYVDNSWYVNGVQYPHATRIPAPAEDVVVTSAGMYNGSWPYKFVNEAPCPPQATDTFSATLGQCGSPATSETTATAVIGNVADGTGLPKDIWFEAVRLQDGWTTGSMDIAKSIQDGEVRTAPIIGSQDVGLLPGDFEVRFYTPGRGQLLAVRTLEVPACGREIVPSYPDDPIVPGGGEASGKPTGVLKQVRGTTKMVARGNNSKVSYTTKFKLTIDPLKGKTVIKTFKVLRNRLGKPMTFRYPAGTKYVLKAQVRFLAKSGRVATKWRVIKRKVSTR